MKTVWWNLFSVSFSQLESPCGWAEFIVSECGLVFCCCDYLKCARVRACAHPSRQQRTHEHVIARAPSHLRYNVTEKFSIGNTKKLRSNQKKFHAQWCWYGILIASMWQFQSLVCKWCKCRPTFLSSPHWDTYQGCNQW